MADKLPATPAKSTKSPQLMEPTSSLKSRRHSNAVNPASPATTPTGGTPVNERRSKMVRQQTQKVANEQLSCVPQTQRRDRTTMKTRDIVGPDMAKNDGDKHKLAEHLRSIAPFNKRWKDVETGVHGVIKVAKSDANGPAHWEAFILEKLQKANPGASVVRVLDKGMLADHLGHGMEFMVLEKAAIPVVDYLNRFTGLERKLHVSYVMLDMLKGIHDMHCQGLLHRDLKPDNMGIMSEMEPVAVLFDLGMVSGFEVRMYTGFFGENRLPRTSVCFRGTPEWASGHANKGREQSRLDDIIGWMYVAVELYDETTHPMQPLPWTTRNNNRAIHYLKSMFAPARFVFHRCPHQFYAINAYLMTANRLIPPDYIFLAQKMMEIIRDLQKKLGSAKLFNRYAGTGKAPLLEEKVDSSKGLTKTK